MYATYCSRPMGLARSMGSLQRELKRKPNYRTGMLVGLEHVDLERDERLTELKVALAEAASATAELKRARAAGRALQVKLLTKDFDLTHERAGKALLADRVEYLEQVAGVRDQKLSEAESLIEVLEAQRASLEAEQGALRLQLLCQEFDLSHASATRQLLSNRVDDLQAEGERLNAALAEARTLIAELEGKAANLEKALAAVRKEERSLRTSQAELRRQVYNLQSDAGVLTRAKTARSLKLTEKERQLADTEAALSRAEKEGAYLSRQLEELQAQRRSEGYIDDNQIEEDEPTEGEDPSVAWVRKLAKVRAVQEKQWSDQESDDEGSSVGKQLANIASAQVEIRRQEEKAEGDKVLDASDEDNKDSPPEKKAANRTYQAAGASVLLASVLGAYLWVAPQLNVPVPSPTIRNPLEQLFAPNPVKQLADVPESEEPSKDLDSPVSGSVENVPESEESSKAKDLPVSGSEKDVSKSEEPSKKSDLPVSEIVGDVSKSEEPSKTSDLPVSEKVGDVAKNAKPSKDSLPVSESEEASKDRGLSMSGIVEKMKGMFSPAEEEVADLAKAIINKETAVSETPAGSVKEQEDDGEETGLGLVFAPSRNTGMEEDCQDVSFETPEESAAKVADEEIPDCAVDMC